jgi:hypothetical protein
MHRPAPLPSCAYTTLIVMACELSQPADRMLSCCQLQGLPGVLVGWLCCTLQEVVALDVQPSSYASVKHDASITQPHRGEAFAHLVSAAHLAAVLGWSLQQDHRLSQACCDSCTMLHHRGLRCLMVTRHHGAVP